MKIHKLKAIYRLLLSLLVAIIGYLFSDLLLVNRSSVMMVGWIFFSTTLVSLDWFTFLSTSQSQIRAQAKEQDESSIAIFIIILLSIIASITGVFVIVVNREQNSVLPLILGSAGMACSWIMLHTIFTIRYAHLYYGNHPTSDKLHHGGLRFPNEEEKPDFVDFAYFSFVIGMTFQVSDIEITDKRMRRLVLMHSVISFAFNTFIVALTINVLAGFSGKQ
jgi:uncharacterized membrane protein